MSNEHPMLKVDRLRVLYPGGFEVGPCDLALEAGLHHLQGANGCGKTTLLRAIAGELRPWSGTCRVQGRDTWRTPEARRGIGYLPAKPDLPGFLRVDECWRFAASMRGAPDWDGVALRRALDIDGRMPLQEGSTGERRKAELLAALAGDPAVLLLDEIFANLDGDTVELVRTWLDQWRSQRVVLFTYHRDPGVRPDSSWQMRRGEPLRESA